MVQSRDRGFRVHLSQALVVQLRFSSPPLDVENLRVKLNHTTLSDRVLRRFVLVYPGLPPLRLASESFIRQSWGQDSSYPNCRVAKNEATRAVPCPCPCPLQSRILKPKPMTMSRSPQRFLFHARRCIYDEMPVRMTIKGYARDALSTSLLGLCRFDLTVEWLLTNLPCQGP